MRLTALACLALTFSAAFAQDDSDGDTALTAEERQELQAMRALLESLHRQSGRIVLRDGLATLDVPQDFYFLDAKDTERVLTEAWHNPPGGGDLGMLFPADQTPFDDDAWAVTIRYDEDGHVSDSDAADIDYGDLLKEMREDIRDANPERTKAGYPEIELVGWAEPPHYDAGTRKLYWAKELRFGDSPETTLNYEIRALGRKGILSMTFVAGTEQLEVINAKRESVLAMADFNEGNRYQDFDASIDKVAAYGIGALIAGKVAAKAGLLAAGLVLLKKFGVVILVALGAVARKAKSVLARSSTPS
jgi:uncharacterized membrane-anchored protein